MKDKKKRCQFCGRWYKPDPRTARFQKACNETVCRKKRQQESFKNWTAKNPGYQRYRSAKIRAWAASRTYWKHYRKSHRQYVRRDNRRRALSRKRVKLSAKQNTISQITLDKLNTIRKSDPFLSAKQITIDRRVDDLIDLLIWKELSAKQKNMVLSVSSIP